MPRRIPRLVAPALILTLVALPACARAQRTKTKKDRRGMIYDDLTETSNYS